MKSLHKLVYSLLFISFFLVGCQENENTGADENGKTVITMWNRLSGLDVYLPEIITSFEEEYPDIKVELENLPVESQEQQYQAAVQENKLPDIFTTGGGYGVPQLVAADQIRPLDEVFTDEVKEKFVTGSFESGQTVMDDKVYAFPVFSPSHGAFMTYYNKDLLEELGIEPRVPDSWKEFMEIGEEVYEKSDGTKYGLLVGMQAGWLISDVTLQMAKAITPETERDWTTGEFNFATQGVIETAEFYKTMLDNNIMSIQSLELGAQDVYTQFANGQSAFMFAGNYVGAQLKDRGLENFGVAKLPTKNGEGVQYGEKATPEMITVSKYTENWDEVQLFINFLIDHMYDYIVESGTSAPALKLDHVGTTESNLAQFNDIAEIMNEVMVVAPNPTKVNPETIKVNQEHGEMAPKEGLDTIINGYLTGQVEDLEGTLQQLTDDNNKALKEAIEQSNGKVSMEDYIFKNWTPGQDYVEEDYSSR
ncbi:ABC transporter substrate-binding protein [Gracilibacillus sp. D59]|uniref:ABC transporter substrate-binding protein n=1 Tax=Gracilibacillus sp. D59 TaxID=3457434 RepID=UPI003FCCDC79